MGLMNRLGNTRNPNQSKAKRVLCVCSAGLLRSPTLANVLHQEFGFNTRAAGVSKDYALVVVDKVLLTWADEVVCVEEEVHQALLRVFRDELRDSDAKVVVLDVPDDYPWNDPELRRECLDQYKAVTATP